MPGYKFIGSKIYYLKENGNVILKTGEAEGWVNPTTVEDDFKNYAELSKYNRDVVDYIELEFGEFKTEFAECTSYRVNIQTKKLEFEYGEKPNPPEIPQTPSLHERMEAQEKANRGQDDLILDNAYRVAVLELSAKGLSL